jgi:hypothetical protein
MRQHLVVRLAIAAAVCVEVASATAWQPQAQPRPRYVTAAEAGAVLQRYPFLPASLRTGTPSVRAAEVTAWISARDKEIRARVIQGEEDALVPWLLFGTSFTRAPRLTRAFFEEQAQPINVASQAEARERAFTVVFERRIDDLIGMLAGDANNARLTWARATLQQAGVNPRDRPATARYLVETFARVTRESEALAAALTGRDAGAAAPRERAHVFAARGLAVDTGWTANFAVSEALAGPAVRDHFRTSPIRRVAIIGPGLDVIDKDEGLDLYPPQSVQPFALMDALRRSGLVTLPEIEVTTLDVNPRVNDHLRSAHSSGRPYVLHLAADGRPWTEGAKAYWSTFGIGIGDETTPPAAAVAARQIALRSVAVRPEWTKRLTVIDANIVCQRIDFAPHERVDLLVATNILLYYGEAEQALAVANMVHLLRPNGVLLTNTRIDQRVQPELTALGETLTAFSNRPGDGEVVYAFARRSQPTP